MKFIPAKLFNQASLCILVLGLCFALTGTSAAQNQFYVNSSAGSDANDGSQARPWKTIQHADSALTLGANGTIVNVAAGNYTGPITINKSGTPTQRIVYKGAPNYGSKITTINWSVNGSYTDIVGFDGTSPGVNGFAIQSHARNSVHILGNYFHDFGVSACGPYGVINDIPFTGQLTNNDTWIIGNVIRRFGNYLSPGTSCVSSHGMYLDGARVIVENNIISGIAAWGIHRVTLPGLGGPDVISNNTVFNSGGGILITENNGVQGPAWDYSTMNNNIVVMNGLAGSGGNGYGINYFHVTGTHNSVNNNLVYGNLPSDYAHHGATCVGGTPISGTDANGTAGGCPSTNPQTDAGGVTATFVNFQTDLTTAPASNYNPDNYQIKAGSNAIQNGTTNCAVSPGLTPCVPATDFVGIVRPSRSTLGVYEQVGAPSAPTGLTALVH